MSLSPPLRLAGIPIFIALAALAAPGYAKEVQRLDDPVPGIQSVDNKTPSPGRRFHEAFIKRGGVELTLPSRLVAEEATLGYTRLQLPA